MSVNDLVPVLESDGYKSAQVQIHCVCLRHVVVKEACVQYFLLSTVHYLYAMHCIKIVRA